jgi:hypothetical protein
MTQDHADVVAAAAQDREEGVAGCALERASGLDVAGILLAVAASLLLVPFIL